MRGMLTFFSTLAFAVMTAAAIVAIMPWLSGRTAHDVSTVAGGGLHLESLLLGVVLGLFTGAVARFEWADYPRRIVTWVLIRERQFFYYALIGGCVAVLLFY